MEWASSEVVKVITYLLPGFLAAWVFYGLTAHPRREPFERVIQALIFTGIVQVITFGVRCAYLWAPGIDWGTWSKEADLSCSVITAFVVGLIFSVFANYGWLHSLLQWFKITKRTSFPSEWFSAFNGDKRYVVLHLTGQRRLYGWPFEWPDSGESGHFVLCDASWMIAETNEMVPIHAAEQIIVPVSSVTMVERLLKAEEMTASPEAVAEAEAKMTALYKKEEKNGKQSTRSLPAENRIAGTNGHAPEPNPASPGSSPAPTSQKIKKGKRRR